MAKIGSRHPLVIYEYMLNRWWKATLTVSISLLVLSAGLGGLPLFLPQYPFLRVEDWRLLVMAGAGGFSMLFTFFLIAIRKKAYVQPYANHLSLVTPFLRMNISYQRFKRTYAAEMQQLFPPNKGSSWRRELIRPLATRTVVVIELSSLPLSRFSLRFFLSPLFFVDGTPRLAILVPDWLAFSTELESLRGAWQDLKRQPASQPGFMSNLSQRR